MPIPIRQMNFNIMWAPAPSGDNNRMSRKMKVNVSESGIVNPGSYEVESKGNVIYWPLKGKKK